MSSNAFPQFERDEAIRMAHREQAKTEREIIGYSQGWHKGWHAALSTLESAADAGLIDHDTCAILQKFAAEQ